METTKFEVNQYHYDGFEDYTDIKNAIMTKWQNGEGLDVYIARRNLPDVNVSLTWDNISLFRKIFSDFEN